MALRTIIITERSSVAPSEALVTDESIGLWLSQQIEAAKTTLGVTDNDLVSHHVEGDKSRGRRHYLIFKNAPAA